MAEKDWVPHKIKYSYLGPGEHYTEDMTVMLPPDFAAELTAIHKENPMPYCWKCNKEHARYDPDCVEIKEAQAGFAKFETVLIGEPAKNVLPKAYGHLIGANTYKFGPRDVQADAHDKTSPYHYLGGILKEAVLHAGKRVVQYNEENGYEYETWAVYDAATNVITSNWYGCPSSHGHHIGSTCPICGLKD